MTTKFLNERRIRSIAHHRRWLDKYLATLCDDAPDISGRKRRRKWLAETLQKSLRAVEADDRTMAARHTIMAATVSGLLGGYWRTPEIEDIFEFLNLYLSST